MRSTARDFFLHLLSTILLYMGMVSLTIVLFQIINHFVPDYLVVDYWQSPMDRIRVPMSILIISFPVFVWTVWYIKKLIEREPEVKDFKIRKWLMYLTVFAAAVIIIVTLIVVLHNFFNGEFTVRFLLKILSVLAIATGVLWYYLIEVKENTDKALTQKIIAWSVVMAVLASVVVGFIVMGSPQAQRARRIDSQRIDNLQNIFYDVENHYRINKVLPKNLAELPVTGMEPAVSNLPTDPETKAPYVYEYLDKTNFKLCATFSQPSFGYPDNKSIAMYPQDRNYFWDHPAGNYCFTRDFSYIDREIEALKAANPYIQ